MFDFFQSVNIALSGLFRNKGRTALTSLGIMIGIASVVMVVSIGSGAQSLIINQIKSVGSDLVGVLPGGQLEDGPPAAILGVTITTLTLEDAEALSDPNNVANVVASTAYVKGSATITYGGEAEDSFFNGVSYSYPDVEEVKIAEGRFFDEFEQKGMERVVVIGSTVAEDLFNGDDPIGQDIKINREQFQVVGVLEKRGNAGFQNRDDQVFVPVNVAQKLLMGIDYVSLVRLKIESGADLDKAKYDVQMTLRERHGITDPEDDDFTVETTENSIEMLSSITDVLKFFLAAIAAISLVIGGIGIMNIMLVSVTERIREIGLRKALGARRRRILDQFLLEAVTVTLVGGAAGVLVGSIMSALVAIVVQTMGYQWDLVISANAILTAFLVCCGVGVVFGYYPARKAANLNPIDALRHE